MPIRRAMGLQPLDDRQDGSLDLGPVRRIGDRNVQCVIEMAAGVDECSAHEATAQLDCGDRPGTGDEPHRSRRLADAGDPRRRRGVFGFELLEESVVDQSLHDRADRRPSDVGETGEVGA